MALYLKYRPQNLDQLIGQEQIKKTLLAAFKAEKLSHAYLFVGPRGTGKTSTARILAKMVNCQRSLLGDSLASKRDNEETHSDVPCNQCTSCLSITDGSSLDLIEIDAASNRGIDDIRSLRENIKLSPAFSKKKVYIIDEVHMLTTEAFNALLKTLEEPPKHALFILATTDAQKVPQTILSRVQRLDFKLATAVELETALKAIIGSEKIAIEDEALKLIVKRAEGSFRDGVKILDQMASGGDKITVSDVSLGLQSVEFNTVLQLIKLISDKNIKDSLLLVSENVNKGTDAKGWILSLMDILRSLLLIKSEVGQTLVAPEYSEERYRFLTDLASKCEINQLTGALHSLQNAFEKLKFSSMPILPLELSIIEMCGVDSRLEEGVGLVPVIESSSPVRDNKVLETTSEMVRASSSDDVMSPEIATLQEKWTFVLETIKPYNFSLEALLRLVKLLDCKNGMVFLEVPYSFHQRILEAPKSRDLLESVLSDVLGKAIRVSCVLAAKPMKAEDVANVEVAADDDVIKAAAEIFGS